MFSFPDSLPRQDILFVCGADRVVNAAAIVSDLSKREAGSDIQIACFAEAGRPSLNVTEKLNATRFEVSSSNSNLFIGPSIRSADIAIIEGLPCALSDLVPVTWRADCNVVAEIIAATLDDAFSQIRIHFLKHSYGDIAKRAEHVRVFFDGKDVTTEFRAHEEQTRVRFSPMNDKVANPGSRDNYHM